jgi:hypothetical protein
MRGLFTNSSLNIQAGQAVSGIAANPHTLRINSGRVWITVEGIRQDYWLRAGDTFTVVPGRLIVIEADKIASRVDITPNRQQASSLLKFVAQMNGLLKNLARNKAVNTVSHQRALTRHQPANCCA